VTNAYIAYNTFVGQHILPEINSGQQNKNVSMGVAIGTISKVGSVINNILFGVDVLHNHTGDIIDNIVLGNNAGASAPKPEPTSLSKTTS